MSGIQDIGSDAGTLDQQEMCVNFDWCLVNYENHI